MKNAFITCLVFGVLFSPPLLRAQIPVVPDVPPRHWIEEVADASGSGDIVSLVFSTIPGVGYSMQTSVDLAEWQTLDQTYYGLGQEVVPMFAKSPAATGGGGGGSGGEPPQPVQPTVNVSLVMRRVTGGGVVLSWRSLDTGTAVQHYLPSDYAAAEWDQMPLYWNSFGTYSFMISCFGVGQELPPSASSLAGPADQTMIEAFQENLSAMNAEVAANVVRARNAVQAPEPSENAKRFWRVVPDWSLDSDGDSTPDWLEFDFIITNGGESGDAFADAFSGDTNGNGVPDGEERDSDIDGVPDKLDSSKSDKLIDWTRNGAMRFAWFDVQPPEEGSKTPLQVNDQGKVLFEKGVWHNGVITDLSAEGTDLTGCRPRALGDSGMVLGTGQIDLPGDDSTALFGCAVVWPAGGDAPDVLQQGESYPNLTYDGSYGLVHGDMLLNEENEFVAITFQKETNHEGESPIHYLQQVESGPRKVWKIKADEPGNPGNLQEQG